MSLTKLNELRQKKAKIHDRNKVLLEMLEQPKEERAGKLSDEQIDDEYQTNEAGIKELDAEISELTKWEERRRIADERDTHLTLPIGTSAPPHPETPNEEGETQQDGSGNPRNATAGYHADIQRQYYGQPRFFRSVRNNRSPEERAYRLGMWGLHIAAATLPNRFSFPKATKFCEEQGLIVHGEGAGDTTGAHLTVPDEFNADLIDLKESRGTVRRLFRREPMMSDTKSTPRRTGGLTAYAVGENAAGTESNMSLDDVLLVARKWMVLTRMSKELDEDNAINFGDVLAGEIAYALTDKEDEAGFNGDGTSTYHGIRGVRNALQDVDLAGTDSAGLVTGAGNLYSELTIGNFQTVVGTLPQYADTDDAVWVMHRSFFYGTAFPLLVALGGTPASEGVNLAGQRRPRPMFLGYPVEFSQVMPSTEANSQVCALLGDFSMGAMFGDRRSETIEFDDTVSVGGQSVWERDQIAVKGTERFDIKVHDIGTSSDAGAIVGLQTAAS